MARTKGSDDLYKLIHSLTAEEKGYFTKFARRHTDKSTRYLKLFERLNDMKVYDEKKLKESFKNLSVEKNYLTGLILDSLLVYNNKPENTQLYLDGLYNRAKILQLKGLPEQARKEFKKGKDIALKSGLPLAAYRFTFRHSELEKLDIKPAGKMQYYAKNYELLSSLLQKEQLALKYALEENKVRLFMMKAADGMNFKTEKADIDFDSLFNPPARLDLKENISRYEALILYFIGINDGANMYLYAKQYYKLTSAQKNRSNNYSRALMFCAHACILNKKTGEAAKWLEVLKKFKSKNEHVNHYNWLRYNYYMLFLYSASNQISKGMEYARHIWEQHSSLFNSTEPNQYYSKYFTQTLYLFFTGKDFESCFELLNSMNLSFVRKNTPFFFCDVELTRLMIQAELCNYELLDGLVRSVTIKFRKYKMDDELTKILLRFFKELADGMKESEKNKFIILLDGLLNKKDKAVQPSYLYLGLKPYQEWIAALSIKKSST